MIEPTSTILPLWFVAPMAIATMLLLAGHLSSIQEHCRPPSRQRIRVANGVLMMFVTPLLAVVLGFATPADPGPFVMGWISVSVMLLMVLMLAMLDMLNTARLHRAELKRLRREALGETALAGLSEAARRKLVGVYDAGHDA